MAHILVIEDDREIRDLIALRLLMVGHSVLAISDAVGALDTVDRIGAPDLYVIDVGLPDIDGFRLLGRLREVGVNAPTIFLSAHAQASEVGLGTAMGAKYLTKPFGSRTLIGAIDEVLSGRDVPVGSAE
ncbi:MAG TPA: response regulator [Kineosporiaceae bacterium]|nr:response regulator [Kineosporiaceae bacterium]